MKRLNTGVEITYDKKGNIKTLYSPYYSEPKNKQSFLEYLLNQIKNILR